MKRLLMILLLFCIGTVYAEFSIEDTYIEGYTITIEVPYKINSGYIVKYNTHSVIQ